MVGTGTLINVAAVAAGTGVGVALGGRLPERVRLLVMAMLGMFTVVMGVADGLDTFSDVLASALGQAGVIVVLGSLVIGGIAGELLNIEGRLEQFGAWLRRKVARQGEQNTFVEGFVVASMVFCVGPLAILGPIQDGLAGNYQLLMVKSLPARPGSEIGRAHV